MTWKELAQKILEMDSESMDTDVTIFNTSNKEFFSIHHLHFSYGSDALYDGHPYLVL